MEEIKFCSQTTRSTFEIISGMVVFYSIQQSTLGHPLGSNDYFNLNGYTSSVHHLIFSPVYVALYEPDANADESRQSIKQVSCCINCGSAERRTAYSMRKTQLILLDLSAHTFNTILSLYGYG